MRDWIRMKKFLCFLFFDIGSMSSGYRYRPFGYQRHSAQGIVDALYAHGAGSAASLAGEVIVDRVVDQGIRYAAKSAAAGIAYTLKQDYNALKMPFDYFYDRMYGDAPTASASKSTLADSTSALPTQFYSEFSPRGPGSSVIRRENLSRYMSTRPRVAYAGKRVATKRTRPVRSTRGKPIYRNYGRYPVQALAAVEASDGQLVMSGMYGRWGQIPKEPPTGLKYFDACTGFPTAVGSWPWGLQVDSNNGFNMGNPPAPNAPELAWDPLMIPMMGVTAQLPYATVRGAGSTRTSQRVVVAAIVVQITFYSPTLQIQSLTELDDVLTQPIVRSSIGWYIDKQCNGAQFAEADVYEYVDNKNTSNLFPNVYSNQHLPSVQNENRFECVGQNIAEFTMGPDDFLSTNIVAADPSLTAKYYSVHKSSDQEFVLKDKFVVDFQTVAYGSGTGAIDQRKSMNFNGVFNSTAVGSLYGATMPIPSCVSILSRTIFYDA